MERRQEKKIGQLLEEFARANNLEQGLAEYRVTKSWHELLGKTVSNATKSLVIKNRILFVKLHSSVLRNELALIKEDLIRRLNESAGSGIIDDIVLK